VQPVARALFNVYTTENSPIAGATLVPLYRLTQVCTGGANCKATRNFAYATGRAGVQSLESIGFQVDGVEGFVFSPSESQPANTLRLCMATDDARMDRILYAASSCDRNQLVNDAGQNTGGNYRNAVTLGFVPSAAQAGSVNYTDMWYNPNESGWGIHIAHHDAKLFSTWYTYDEAGNQLFVTMTCDRKAFDGNSCEGDLYRLTGPSYRDAVFDPSKVRVAKAGTGTLRFLENGNATFSVAVNGINLTKSIVRQPYGSASTSYPADLSDHYYRADQSGWGVTAAQHGNKAFVAIFAYDTNGNPMFVLLPNSQSQNGALTGSLYRTQSVGSHWLSPSFNSNDVRVTEVGTATLRPDGARIDYEFTVDGHTQRHTLTRLPF
jgi:hypothetical protein